MGLIAQVQDLIDYLEHGVHPGILYFKNSRTVGFS